MTNSPRRVQNSSCSRAVSGQAAARRPKLRVERRPFLASKAVIFGVNSTGPHILGVIVLPKSSFTSPVRYRVKLLEK